MKIEQIIRDYLPRVIHMSLATSSQNKPWVCEVHFSYDNDLNLYFRSTEARRHSKEISTNPYVAGNIVVQHQPSEVPFGVYFEGIAAKLTNQAEIASAALFISKCQNMEIEDILAQVDEPKLNKIYKISVDTYYVFGNVGDGAVQKHELPWNKK